MYINNFIIYSYMILFYIVILYYSYILIFLYSYIRLNSEKLFTKKYHSYMNIYNIHLQYNNYFSQRIYHRFPSTKYFVENVP